MKLIRIAIAIEALVIAAFLAWNYAAGDVVTLKGSIDGVRLMLGEPTPIASPLWFGVGEATPCKIDRDDPDEEHHICVRGRSVDVRDAKPS